jgi:hypothetical protein
VKDTIMDGHSIDLHDDEDAGLEECVVATSELAWQFKPSQKRGSNARAFSISTSSLTLYADAQ